MRRITFLQILMHFVLVTPHHTTQPHSHFPLSRPDSVSLLISFILSLTPSCPLYVCLFLPLCLSPSLSHYLSHYLSLSSNSASSGSHAAHNGFHSSHSGLMGGSHSFSDPSLVKLPQVSYLLPLRFRVFSLLSHHWLYVHIYIHTNIHINFSVNWVTFYILIIPVRRSFIDKNKAKISFIFEPSLIVVASILLSILFKFVGYFFFKIPLFFQFKIFFIPWINLSSGPGTWPHERNSDAYRQRKVRPAVRREMGTGWKKIEQLTYYKFFIVIFVIIVIVSSFAITNIITSVHDIIEVLVWFILIKIDSFTLPLSFPLFLLLFLACLYLSLLIQLLLFLVIPPLFSFPILIPSLFFTLPPSLYFSSRVETEIIKSLISSYFDIVKVGHSIRIYASPYDRL